MQRNKPSPKFRYGNHFELALRDMEDTRKKLEWFPSNNNRHRGPLAENALHGFIGIDGKKDFAAYACHKDIRKWTNAVALWSCFGYRTTEEVARFYLSWLLERSPWSKTGIIPRLDKEYVFQNGLCWDSLDTIPSNLLHNFLIASRAAAEWPDSVNVWYKLVTEYGINENLAFVFLTMFGNYQDSGSDFFIPNIENRILLSDRYDWPLDTGRAEEDTILNFVNGRTPGLSERMFYPTAETLPVNFLWGYPRLAFSETSYPIILEKIYLNNKYTTKTRGKEEKSSPFREFSDLQILRMNRVFRPEQVIEVIREEQKRLL